MRRPQWWVTASRQNQEAVRRYVSWLEGRGIGARVTVGDPATPEDWQDAQALLLTGGGDVNPTRYGQRAHPLTGRIDDERDVHEIRLVHLFVQAGLPVFGICRGLQVITVAFGGRLIQHVPDWLPGEASRAEPHQAGGQGADARHEVRWQPDTRMALCLGTLREVNSSHHQAADPASPGDGLRITALSPAGVVEGLEDTRGRIVSAVQWHPERMTPPADATGMGVLDHWLRLAAGRDDRTR